MSKLWIGHSNGCWLDLWDEPNFAGHHFRLWGPSDYPLLRIGEAGTKPSVQSLRVGPGAYVHCYEDLNFDASVVWMLPGQSVRNFADLQCSDELDCIRLFDRPPYAREPGYPAYMLWAASQLKRAGETQANHLKMKPDGMH